MSDCFLSGEDDKKAEEEKVVTSNQLLAVIEEAYPNSLTLDDMSRYSHTISVNDTFWLSKICRWKVSFLYEFLSPSVVTVNQTRLYYVLKVLSVINCAVEGRR